jgi:hypothetical protein
MSTRTISLVAWTVMSAFTLALGSAPASARQTSCPDSNLPNEIVLSAGSGQTAQLGQPFQVNFQVKLANDNGCPITGNLAGINITFDGPDSGPSGVFAGSGWHEATVGTDSNGVATAPTFTANFTAGAYTVFEHSAYGDVQFSVTNTATGVAAAISAIDGSGQSALVSSRYAEPLQVKVIDAGGQPVQGASVSFSVAAGSTGAGASFLAGAQATMATNSAGVATSPPLLANNTPGRFTALASVSGVAAVATFTLDNHAGAQRLIRTTTRNTTAVGTVFRSPLKIKLVDANGHAIEGQAITFALAAQGAGTAGASGAGATFRDGSTAATAVTNADGVASSPPFTANHTTGAFAATARTSGVAPATFTLRNKAGRAASIAVGAASGESTPTSTRFLVPLVATISDRFGNPVVRATVFFAAPRHGASGHFVARSKRRKGHRSALSISVKTNAKGIAVAPPFVANRSVGGYLIRVAVKGSAARASFALVNTPGA